MSEVNIGDEKYHLSIFGHQIEVTEPMREYVKKKLHHIEHLTDQIIDVAVRLEVQKIDHRAEVVMKFSHFKIVVHATTTDLYATLDKVFEKLQTKLTRWKSRMKEHHAKKSVVDQVPVKVLEQQELDEINDQIEEENLKRMEEVMGMPRVLEEKTIPLKTLNIHEAIMKMELSHDNFMVYRCEESKQLRVIYRRRDGSYGIISAEERAVS
ncbi:MAG: ribosome-associated translation inhibitor RaiA [Chlamydiales bacterium]